jgi:glycogen synthase
MRILMTTDTVGGVWTYTRELIEELLARESAVALVTVGREPSPAQKQWLKKVTDRWGDSFLWEESAAPLEWMSNNEGAFRDAVPLLSRLVKEFEAQVLHSNQFCFGALDIPIRKLVVAHSDVLSWAESCRGGILARGKWLENYMRLVSAGLRAANVVVAPTRWMLNALEKNFPSPHETRVIANGRTVKDPTLRSVYRLQAVTAGRLWDEAKNLKLLQTLLAPLPILVAGEIAYESETAPSMPANITLLGSLDENELLALFQESAIYLCTSVYEPFGLAPLEAALCGCAILAHDIPSLREVWGDGALYFRDASSLSARLTRLAYHPQHLIAAQHRSWQRAQEYSAKNMADRYLALYQSMLKMPRITNAA